MDAASADFTAPLRKLEDELTQLRKEYEATERDVSRKSSLLNRSIEELQHSNREITRCGQTFTSEEQLFDLGMLSYERSDGQAQLQRCQSAISDFNTQIKGLDTRMNGIKEAMALIEKEAAEADIVRRNIIDNLRYRDIQRKCKTINDEIAALDTAGAEKSHRLFKDQYEDQRKLQTTLQAKVWLDSR